MTFQQLRYVIAIEKYASFSEAAKNLFVSQPSISAAVRSLERELGITIFNRTNTQITLTTDGQELLGFAYQAIDKADALSEYFVNRDKIPKTSFSVSSQHYGFANDLLTCLIPDIPAGQYKLRVKQTTTSMVIEDVAKHRSEIGIIYISEYSEKYFCKVLRENNLSFTPLITSKPHAFMHSSHPLSGYSCVTKEDLLPYPCIIFDQNDNIPIYYAEEIHIPDHNPSKIILVSDMFSNIRFMENSQAYNIGTGLLYSMDKTSDYYKNFIAVPIKEKSLITLGFINVKNIKHSPLGEKFIALLQDYAKMHEPSE